MGCSRGSLNRIPSHSSFRGTPSCPIRSVKPNPFPRFAAVLVFAPWSDRIPSVPFPSGSFLFPFFSRLTTRSISPSFLALNLVPCFRILRDFFLFPIHFSQAITSNSLIPGLSYHTRYEEVLFFFPNLSFCPVLRSSHNMILLCLSSRSFYGTLFPFETCFLSYCSHFLELHKTVLTVFMVKIASPSPCAPPPLFPPPPPFSFVLPASSPFLIAEEEAPLCQYTNDLPPSLILPVHLFSVLLP